MTSQSRGRRRALGLEEQVYLELLRTSEALSRGFSEVLRSEDLSPTQYNVLRILRGARDGLACGEIASRMITHDPDITRLLDRLEKRDLISRWRLAEDRRVVMARILGAGLRLLARLEGPVEQIHRRQLGHLGRDRLDTLRRLLEACRRDTR
jgi:DNA-binding MarR family transcriptional regulator